MTTTVERITRFSKSTRAILGQASRVRSIPWNGYSGRTSYVIDLTAGRDCSSRTGVRSPINAPSRTQVRVAKHNQARLEALKRNRAEQRVKKQALDIAKRVTRRLEAAAVKEAIASLRRLKEEEEAAKAAARAKREAELSAKREAWAKRLAASRNQDSAHTSDSVVAHQTRLEVAESRGLLHMPVTGKGSNSFKNPFAGKPSAGSLCPGCNNPLPKKKGKLQPCKVCK